MTQERIRPVTQKNIPCSGGRYGDPQCPNKADICQEMHWTINGKRSGTSFFYFCNGCFARQKEGVEAKV